MARWSAVTEVESGCCCSSTVSSISEWQPSVPDLSKSSSVPTDFSVIDSKGSPVGNSLTGLANISLLCWLDSVSSFGISSL
uniref:Uncharacterized protein n=1 Tax=Arundo donax TaxID=35708 RepID=A0A0A9FNV1_ARUDO